MNEPRFKCGRELCWVNHPEWPPDHLLLSMETVVMVGLPGTFV